MRSFPTICLFLLLGISTAQKGTPGTLQPVVVSVVPIDPVDPVDPIDPVDPVDPNDSEYSCSSLYPEPPEYCPKIYRPVCAKIPVKCAHDSCPPTEQTYANGCIACKDPNVISYTHRECKKKIEEKYCKEDYPYPPYPCPKNYDPVCVTFHVQCIKAPCPPIKKEYANACLACNDYAGSYTPGPCEEEEENEEEISGEYENEEWICENYEDYEAYENGEEWICEDFEEYEEYEESEEYEEEIEPEKKVCNVIPNIQVLCIYDYIPVCGYFNGCPNGVCQETYKNNCVACYYAGADYYIDGECPSAES